MQFLSKSKEAGFNVREAEVLRRLATQSGFSDPISILTSQEHLDMCIRLLIQEAKASGRESDQEIHGFLSKLYDYRKRIDIDGPEKKALSNTRQIQNGQPLQIRVSCEGTFKSQLVKNAGGYMTISRPVNSANGSMKSWRGARISVYFWKEDDAGYVFDTEVQDEVYSLGIVSLKISHSFALSRVQKRKSVRVKMNAPAFLYLVGEGEALHKIESSPGLKCILEDLSDTGYAVTVGGRAGDGLRVKAQFELNNAAVCVSGTVRSAMYRDSTDRSVLRIEADPLPSDTRNQILGKVFGTAEEYDEIDLSFRRLEDEAIGAMMDKLPAQKSAAVSQK